MNRYIVIDLKENNIISTNELEHIVYDTFDRFGSSISCRDKEDLIEEMRKILSEMENENKNE